MSDLIYTTSAICSGGRAGVAKLSDNPTQLKLVLPKELGGEGADKGFNPEQLFAAAYASCFEGACDFVSRRDSYGFKPLQIQCNVSLLKREGGFRVHADITAYYNKDVDQALAEKLTQSAHIVCPYSYIIKGNVDVKLTNIFE